MKTKRIKKRLPIWLAVICLLFCLLTGNAVGMYEAKADSLWFGDPYIVLEYDVEMTVREDRKIVVHEDITVLFKTNNATMFFFINRPPFSATEWFSGDSFSLLRQISSRKSFMFSTKRKRLNNTWFFFNLCYTIQQQFFCEIPLEWNLQPVCQEKDLCLYLWINLQ